MYSNKNMSYSNKSTAFKQSIRREHVDSMLEKRRTCFMLGDKETGWRETPELTLDGLFGEIEGANGFNYGEQANMAVFRLLNMFKMYGTSYLKEFKLIVPRHSKKDKIIHILSDWLKTCNFEQSTYIIDTLTVLAYFCSTKHLSAFFESSIHDTLLLHLFTGQTDYNNSPVIETFELLERLYKDNVDQISKINIIHMSKLVTLLIEYSKDKEIKLYCLKFFAALCTGIEGEQLKGVKSEWIHSVMKIVMSTDQAEQARYSIMILASITNPTLGHDDGRTSLFYELLEQGVFKIIVNMIYSSDVFDEELLNYMLCIFNNALCLPNAKDIDTKITNMPYLIEAIGNSLLKSTTILQTELTLTLIKNYLLSCSKSQVYRVAQQKQLWPRMMEILIKPPSNRIANLEAACMQVVPVVVSTMSKDLLDDFTGCTHDQLADFLLCYVERSLDKCPDACYSALSAVINILDKCKSAESDSPPLQVAQYKYIDMLDDLLKNESGYLNQCREATRIIIDDYIKQHPFKE
jgi:hypothetical protein